MNGIGSNNNSQLNAERRTQMREAQVTRLTEEKAVEKATTVQPSTATAAEVQVRTPADVATVDAARTRAAGNEDAAKTRALAKNSATGDATSPARGLQPQAGSCPIDDLVERGELSIDQLRIDIRKRGSGKGISSDDGTNCAPDPTRVIDV
jgi:hypothetical protein